MIPLIAEVLLFFALILLLFQCSFLCVSRIREDKKLISLLQFSNKAVFASILAAFLSLVYLHIVSDFSVLNVYLNSHQLKPLIYKISGVWGNHEGSMLLFILLLSLFSFLFGREREQIITISFQSLIIACFLAFLIFTSNPFTIISPVPVDGMGLNPLLQDIGLAIHPPILYVGYTGFSIALSFAVSGLIQNKIDRSWAKQIKKWIMFSWSFLTLGIGIGSWWAYRELGWGGFWFWDPVENSSLMPWLSATALFHSVLVLEKRNTLKEWVILLSLLTFTLAMLGFFLVRSGILTSVHSFANDPSRGVFILLIITIISGSAFLIYALKADKIKNSGKDSGKNSGEFNLISKEGSILFNNLFMLTLLGVVLLGTLYPILLQVFASRTVSVGAPYYNIVFVIIALVMLLFAGIGPVLKWQKDDFAKYLKQFAISDILALTAGILVFYLQDYRLTAALFGVYCSVWLLTAAIFDIIKKHPNRLSVTGYAVFISHAGVAILAFGISILAGWQSEEHLIMKPGDRVNVSSYDVELDSVVINAKENYIYKEGKFSIWRGGKQISKLRPQERFYPIEDSKTTEAALMYSVFSNLYIVIGEEVIGENNGEDGSGNSVTDGYHAVKIFYKPGINLIWLGVIMISAGGIITIFGYSKKK